MSTFYPQNDYRGYLSHHGIKGQKWGEQNGPPYPLSTKLHNFVVKKQAKMAEDRKIKAEKRKEKKRVQTLHDPKKLYKHASEFSTEELNAAVEKIDAMNKVKSRIPGNEEKILNSKIKKYGKSATELEKNTDKFSTKELKEAADRIGVKHDIYNKKMSELDRPRKFLKVGSDLLGTIAEAFGNAKRIGDIMTPKYDLEGFTSDERRKIKIYEKYKNDPEKLKSIGVSMEGFADKYNKWFGKDTEKYESFFRSGLENGNINWEDIPDDIQETLKNKKGFKQYAK